MHSLTIYHIHILLYIFNCFTQCKVTVTDAKLRHFLHREQKSSKGIIEKKLIVYTCYFLTSKDKNNTKLSFVDTNEHKQ